MPFGSSCRSLVPPPCGLPRRESQGRPGGDRVPVVTLRRKGIPREEVLAPADRGGARRRRRVQGAWRRLIVSDASNTTASGSSGTRSFSSGTGERRLVATREERG